MEQPILAHYFACIGVKVGDHETGPAEDIRHHFVPGYPPGPEMGLSDGLTTRDAVLDPAASQVRVPRAHEEYVGKEAHQPNRLDSLQLAWIGPFLDTQADRSFKRLLVQKLMKEAALDSDISQGPISRLARPFDEFEKAIIRIACDSVTLGIDDIALHLAALTPEEMNEILLRKVIIIVLEAAHRLIALDPFKI